MSRSLIFQSYTCTVFENIKRKTLNVNGLQRAGALTIACDQGQATIARMTIVECFGPSKGRT